MSAELQKLYDQIPAFSCKPGCGDCCGPVPFSTGEAAAAKEAGAVAETGEQLTTRLMKALISGDEACLTCPHRTPVGCAIYEHRPFMCRIYGATQDPGLACPHGCGPLNPLPVEQVRTMMDEYIAILKRDERKAVPA